MKILDVANTTLALIFFLIGVLGMIILSHEAYHLFAIDGTATGVCFGNCNTGNTYDNFSNNGGFHTATVMIVWKLTEEQHNKINLQQQETNAWIFSFIFTGILAVFFLYTEYKRWS